jgi:hypothetical protein
MLEFNVKPDAVFTKLLDDALLHTIDLMQPPDFDYVDWFYDPVVQSLGGGDKGAMAIYRLLRRLHKAHVSKKVYRMGTIYGHLIDVALRIYCNTYNDNYDEEFWEEYRISYEGQPIRRFVHENIVEFFFKDYHILYSSFSCPKKEALMLEEVYNPFWCTGGADWHDDYMSEAA